MLDALRRGSTGMVAKALFAILVMSFAIWGIGPVFRNFGRGALAKVGPHEIRVEDFQRSLQNELRAIRQGQASAAGEGMAMAGRILVMIGTALLILGLVVGLRWALFFGGMAAIQGLSNR